MRAFVRPRRAGVLVAIPALAVLGLTGIQSAGAAATQSPLVPAGHAALTAGTKAPPKLRFLSPPPTKPKASGVKQGCETPARAGQMQCLVLMRTNVKVTAAAVRAATARANAVPANVGYGPADLQNAYGLATLSASAGQGETVAIVDAFGYPTAAADLAAYRSVSGLPACDTTTGAGCLTQVNETGGTALPAADPTGGWEVEESLDMDMVSAICPQCRILLVEATTPSILDLAPAENTAAASAKFVSNSWGSGGEFVGENTFDSAFNHPGVAITAASGDFGYGTQWPSASQLVTSVGGTTLTREPTTRGWAEAAWGGSGSGCSTLEPKPAWQVDTSASAPAAGCANRAENDVASVADPNTGVAIYDTFNTVTAGLPVPGWNEVGGTSVATPIIAATYALAGTPAPGTYPSSYLYQHSSALNQVITGADGRCESARPYLCSATPFASTVYTGPTGLGAPAGVAGFLAASTGNVVTVLNPGTQDLADGPTAPLPIQAVDSGSAALTYSATGLPAGLAINAATGVISGSDSAAAGTASATVTATDGTAASGSVTFNMVTVASMATDYHAAFGPVKLALGGKCLNDTGNSAANGNPIQIFTCNGGAAQNWEFKPDGNPGGAGVISINGKCLDIVHAGIANGSKIDLWPCNSGAKNQQWGLAGFGLVVNPASGKCLDDTGQSTTNGTQVQIFTCTGGPNQTWTLTASPVQSGVSGKCLDDTANGTASGTRTEIWTCNGGNSQKWVLAADGTIRINGKCLDLATGFSAPSLLDGAQVALVTCSGNPDQVWNVGPDGELINGLSGRCLDDPGGSTVNGTALDQQDCYGNTSEVWAAT
jgi:hypothetical protein